MITQEESRGPFSSPTVHRENFITTVKRFLKRAGEIGIGVGFPEPRVKAARGDGVWGGVTPGAGGKRNSAGLRGPNSLPKASAPHCRTALRAMWQGRRPVQRQDTTVCIASRPLCLKCAPCKVLKQRSQWTGPASGASHVQVVTDWLHVGGPHDPLPQVQPICWSSSQARGRTESQAPARYEGCDEAPVGNR